MHDVTLAFAAHATSFADQLLAAMLLKVRHGVDLRANEAAFKVGVNDAGGLRGSGSLQDRPGANFLGTGSEVTLQTKQLIGRTRHGVQRGLVHPKTGKHLGAVVFGEFRKFALNLGAHHHHIAAVGLGVVAHFLHQWAGSVGILLVNVGHKENRLGGDHSQGAQNAAFLFLQFQTSDRIRGI